MTNYLCNDITENLDDYNIKEKNKTKSEFVLELSNILEFEIKNFINNFQGENLIVVGNYGRWDGNYKVCKSIKNSKELISFLNQWDYYRLYEENNKVKITCYDHDGHSYFELKQVRKMFEENYNNIIEIIKPNTVEKYFKRITKNQMKKFFN